ncbi:phosphate ABC transporter substrate-binding/OmpA family protein [Parasulfitobacter algicola]|uniref:Substrate-binding domain-containing protein n=1 Tax=Parasulfitobacter algicola TaxID=2614809 RepID=A0ABX2ILV4_9RHOB|nr:phosphate ABC transporter substrate-binding/OmpA family protein [Sulfitobacter algicola]NSX53505.1 substrate-binding domain-containing protein [Sulfitobacter algicola]
MNKKTTLASALALCLTTIPAFAEKVTLTSIDESISVTGELINFDGDRYVIRTVLGEITLLTSQVNCFGEGCPAASFDEPLQVAASPLLKDRLLPALMDGFGKTIGANETSESRSGSQTVLKMSDSSGSDVAEVVARTSDSASALNAVARGQADVALTYRQAQPGEAQALGGGSQESILALDGIIIVTSSQNPVRSISEEDIPDVFSGRITNWSQLGGSDAPITLYAIEESAGISTVFNDLVMQPSQARFAPSVQVLDSNEAVAEAVSQDPFGIGFTSFSSVGDTKPLAIRGTCGIQTVPNAFTIKTEEYPLTRRLYMYKNGRNPSSFANSFATFASTQAAQDAIAEAGFVDQGVSSLTINNQGLRFVASVLPSEAEVTVDQVRGMMRDLVSADRLSLTFRFEQGSSRLDTRAEGDIVRLAQMIENGEFDNKELLIIGFTDSIGLANLNEELSAQRASSVRDSLLAALSNDSRQNVRTSVLGYGEMSPLGCNDTFFGRLINRRVEVWTRDVVTSPF